MLARKNQANFGPARFWPSPLLARPSPDRPARLSALLIRSTGALIRSTEVLISSARALIKSTEVLIRSAGALIRTGVLCHLITGLRQFYNHMSSVTYYHIIGAFFATLCVHDILYFTFMVTCQFVFILHIIFMFHEHSYAFCISYIFHVTITYDISYTCTV